VTARAIQADGSKIKSSAWFIYFSQPLINIRLSTYSPKLIGKNLLSLDYSNFARHYFRNRWLLSFPRPTKMFQFRHLPLTTLYIQVVVQQHYSLWVSPFGDLRFKGCWHLPEAYRSLLRPSSVTYVKASVICAYVAFYEYLYFKRSTIYAFFN
jgi:hypothetical protein